MKDEYVLRDLNCENLVSNGPQIPKWKTERKCYREKAVAVDSPELAKKWDDFPVEEFYAALVKIIERREGVKIKYKIKEKEE